VTGGSNVPALNELLAAWGIAFGDIVLDGEFDLGGRSLHFASGTSLVRFPADGIVIIPDKGLTVSSMFCFFMCILFQVDFFFGSFTLCFIK